MNILTIKNVTLGITLAASAITASAQKKYTEGVLNYNVNAMGQDIEARSYFKGDSTTFGYQAGPAKIKMIGTGKADYFAVLVDVPVASIKKAAVSNPGELEEAASMMPEYTFTATTEAKKIGDFNCKKYIAKDTKSGATYDLWVTNDISIPSNILTRSYASVGGVPVMFTYLQPGQKGGMPQTITLKSVSDEKVPAGTFGIPSDFDKITMDELKAMSGGRKQ